MELTCVSLISIFKPSKYFLSELTTTLIGFIACFLMLFYVGEIVSEGITMSHELNNWHRIYISNLGNVFEKEKWGR